MAEINILNSKIFNRIAAGEVVERPASVVKELVENSIDALSTEILIEISDGGLSCIRIVDNGCGIEKKELKKALMPHATSKISSIKDLDNITSLGFRGEALASIASVSKIKISSKTKNDEIGAEISSHGGEIFPIIESGVKTGTEITVNNLFYNAPVRAKFLKSVKSEENEISAFVSRFILGNPNISFKYIVDGKLLLQSFGDGIESAFISVYGAEILKNCFYIDTIKNGIKINGYIGKHNFTKSNRGHQTLFVNKRFVIDQTVSSSISNAYSPYLMKRQYPFYVLNLQMPTDFVDVNVHPNKTQIRFLNNQVVYGSIFSIISKVLDGSSEILNIVSDNTLEQGNLKKNTNILNNDYVKHNSFSNNINAFDNLTFSDVNKKEKENEDAFLENKAFLENLEKNKNFSYINTNKNAKEPDIKQETFSLSQDYKVIGQALNTYLILESLGDLYFIDQHAAHERILYDKILQSFEKQDFAVQPLLIPFIINANSHESEFIISKTEFFSKIGVEIEEFGINTFKVSTLPSFISDINLNKFFSELLADVNVLKNISVIDVLKEEFAQKACKSAIKSGDELTQMEIEELLILLKENSNLKCPHGRPVVVKIQRTEIDKWFKRIV